MDNPNQHPQSPKPAFIPYPTRLQYWIVFVAISVVEVAALFLGLILGYGETERYTRSSMRNPQLGPTAEGLSAINQHYQIISHLWVWIPVIVITAFAIRGYRRRQVQLWVP